MFKVIIDTLPILLFSYSSQVLFKQGVNEIGGFDFAQLSTKPFLIIYQLFTNWRIILGFILAGIGAIFYLLALSKHDLTIVFPVLGALGFILLPIIGTFLLHESISLGRIFGIMLVAVGMIIISIQK